MRKALWDSAADLARLQQRVFERWLGVSTTGQRYLDELGLCDADRVHYEECQWLPTCRALKTLGPGPADVLVDLGSGKGQALLIAGLLPYGRVIGVELAEELTQAARRNIAAARPRLKAAEVEAVTDDVLSWKVPDDLSVVFMYCPFMGEVFHRTAERIFASFDANPRPLHIVYDYPWEHDWLLATGRVVVEDVLPAQWPPKPWWWRSGWAIVVYRVVPEGQGGPGRPNVRRRLLRPRRALARWSGPNEHVFKLTRGGEVVRRSDGAGGP